MNNFEKIRRYLEKTMSEDERHNFEQAMDFDPDLKAAVMDHELYQNLSQEIILGGLSDKIKKNQLLLSKEARNSRHYYLIILAILSMICLLYTSPSPRDATLSRMPSSA